MKVAPTPKDTIFQEGTARLYHFRRPTLRPADGAPPILVVPSLINRWYILDLRDGASVVETLRARYDTYLLDWGAPEDEDRFLSWERILLRLARAIRRVRRETGRERVTLLGYCMGGTLAAIHAALHPEQIAGLINLAGPIDFSAGGMLRTLVDPQWFDPEAIAAAGNVAPQQMQAGFQALRPTLTWSKWMGYFNSVVFDPEAREAFWSLETWANDNTSFPAAAYETYIRDLYQDNALVEGRHRVFGRDVKLGNITCPVLSVFASKDSICPKPAAEALVAHVGSKDTEVLEIRGGHVGSVVGPRAQQTLYPALVDWIGRKASPPSA